MTWFLESLDLEVWKTILFGYTFPTKDVDGGKIRKTLDEYSEEESRKFQLNSRAIYILVCAMDRNEYNRISQCKTAKEIWRILDITHEGTTQVKDSKVRIVENDYEMFKMKPNESIVEMFCHAPIPGPTRLADPNRFPGRETQDWDSLPDFFFF